MRLLLSCGILLTFTMIPLVRSIGCIDPRSAPGSSTPHSFCASLVSYPYILVNIDFPPPWDDFTGLDEACTYDLQKFICSNLYLRCAVGIDAHDTSTWPTTFGTPYPADKRPCVSVCSQVAGSCRKFMDGAVNNNLLPFFNIAGSMEIPLICQVSSLALVPGEESLPPNTPLFDPSNDLSTCYLMDFCGDGRLSITAGEQCDDGGQDPGDGI
jgi:hypothetical protein